MGSKFSNRLVIGKECFEIFITSDAFPEMPMYGIHMAGISHLKPPYVVERTDQNSHTLLYTSSGRGKLITTEAEIDISSETMTVIPGNTHWRFEIDDDHWNMCWILLPSTLHWNRLMPKIGEVRACAQVLNIFHLSHVIDQERHLSKAFREQSFEKLARYIVYNLQNDAPVQDDRLSSAFAIVEQSLHKTWTVGDIAGLTYYSEPHLFRLCKERYGKSPKQVIRDLRIERAKQFLQHTDWPISEIAGRLGFSDQFNFSNRFKTEVGQSPVAYRKQF